MSTLAGAILDIKDPNELGETLRALTFPGEGYGCYRNFDVREGATGWAEDAQRAFWTWLDHCDPGYVDECVQLGEGYDYLLGGLLVNVAWYWDGDGTLAFGAWSGGARRVVINTDCKKSRHWQELDPALPSPPRPLSETRGAS